MSNDATSLPVEPLQYDRWQPDVFLRVGKTLAALLIALGACRIIIGFNLLAQVLISSGPGFYFQYFLLLSSFRPIAAMFDGACGVVIVIGAIRAWKGQNKGWNLIIIGEWIAIGAGILSVCIYLLQVLLGGYYGPSTSANAIGFSIASNVVSMVTRLIYSLVIILIARTIRSVPAA
jgi:hypothetical protein